MAIKYYSITDTSDNHLETLKGVLESVAADYFTSFVLSDDKFTLSCYDGENPLLVFTMATGRKTFKVTANGASGISAATAGSNTSAMLCTRITTTACGVALKFTIANNDKSYGIFITKTKNGETAVFLNAGQLVPNQVNNNYCITSGSANANRVSSYVNSVSTSQSSAFPPIGDLTVLAPIVVSGTTDYCPNLFVMVNSQYYGTEGIIDIDGVKYLSNGYYILKDE